jgi:spermidine/putrescine transport system ATP-binding protein
MTPRSASLVSVDQRVRDLNRGGAVELPLDRVDARVRAELRDWLRRLHDEVHVTTVFVTHDQEEALAVSDRIAVMFEGEIAQLADPETLYRRPNSRKVADFIGTMNFLPAKVLSETGSVVEVESAGFGRIQLDASQVMSGGAAADGAAVGFRPETLTILYEGSAASDRESMATIEEVVYFGDMTYYDVRIDGSDVNVRISMRNVFGRPVLDRGARARVGWSPGALVMFR